MEFLGFFLAILVFAGIIMLYFMYILSPNKNKGKGTGLSKDFVSDKWADIGQMMNQGGPANYKQAIFEGDKLVDNVLGSKVSGETMGERLKNSKHLFSKGTYDALWTSHKIRNRLAHEAGFEGLDSEAKLALKGFEKALRELRVI